MPYESEGSLKLYLREISKTPLLTAEEEIALSERIKNGDFKANFQLIEAPVVPKEVSESLKSKTNIA